MENSIQYFNEVCIQRFVEMRNELYQNPKNLAEYIQNLEKELRELGRNIIAETLGEMNQALIDSERRKKHWVVEKHVEKELVTSLGAVRFRKTLFTSKDKSDNDKPEMCYLLDKALGITPNQRLTDDATARIYEEAVQTSYRRGGESVSIEDHVSKEAVKELLHKTIYPAYIPPKEKKKVPYLYIDADEDHYHLQFRETKGDIVRNENGRKNNGAINKLIYVYEGIEDETPGGKRKKLIGAHYFCRGTNQSNESLWKEVFEYIDQTYNADMLIKIYLNADGGNWITEGAKVHAGTRFVLDEFHLSKYMSKMTRHLKDSQWDGIQELRSVVKYGKKADFEIEVERLLGYAKTEGEIDRINEGKKYILSNWGAAKLRLQRPEAIVGSSTEGHVYHILSSRMSTDPLGWSLSGGSQMARLLEYYKNDGDMLVLARYQKEELKQAAGAEELANESLKMIDETKHHRTPIEKEYGKYSECMQTSLPRYLKDAMARYNDDYYIRTWF